MTGERRIALLFDIDGTLIVSGGAGASSWRLAFDELYGIPADIGEFTDTGMTDPDVGRQTFEAVLDREPSDEEFAKLLERRQHYLHRTVAESDDYRVLPGVEALLPRLLEEGYLLGLVTGNLERSAHTKLHRARLNRFFSFGGYASDSRDRDEVTRIALRKAALVYGAPLRAEHGVQGECNEAVCDSADGGRRGGDGTGWFGVGARQGHRRDGGGGGTIHDAGRGAQGGRPR